MAEFIILLIKVLIVLQLILGLASFCTWIERKASALLQDRIGANRAGAFLTTDNIFLKPLFFFLRIAGVLGFINTLACDPVKGFLKEDFVPEGCSNFMHALAPFIAVCPVILACALIPFAPDFELFGYYIRPQVASLNVGVLFILAMSSVTVFGIIIAGWTAGNKFSMLGALRATAQMISYELALGIVFATLIIEFGTFDLYEIVEQQSGGNWGLWASPTSWLSFILLFVVGMAETKRAPFDLPESESELVAGYMTEYSGMKFLMFWLAEFSEIVIVSILLTLFFFGGWDPLLFELPANVWWAALIGHGVLLTKVLLFCTLQVVIRWTLPRFRFDQLMHLGWKILLPLSLVNLVVTAALKIVMG